MLELILMIVGFVIIIKASNVLVDCASALAVRAKLPKMLIALTIVSFGTCAPEVAISFTSVSSGNGTMAFANVIGSCIVNVLLIIGIACLVKPIRVKHATIRKELPILFVITTGFCLLMLDSLFGSKLVNTFSRKDGIFLMLLFSMFVIYLVQMLFRKKDDSKVMEVKYSMPKSIIYIIIAIILIIFSSDLIVNNAVSLAEKLNISQKVITMVGIVIGTSLPELVMTVTSAKKGEFDMAIGNIIGTNIFNICIVLGLPVAIFGDVVLSGFGLVDILVVFLSSFLLYIFASSDRSISKGEATFMVLIFTVYYGYLFIC